MSQSSQHLDVDALADVLADGHEPEHLSTCEACQARLAELAEVLPSVAQALAGLPLPDPPADLEGRLRAALAREASPAPTNVLPMKRPRTRWLPALAGVAAATVLVAGGVLVAQRSSSPSRVSGDVASARGYRVSTTGTDYTAKSLPLALPGLLTGPAAGRTSSAGVPPVAPAPAGTNGVLSDQKQPQLAGGAAPDPLAELRTTAGLARCLASLTDASQSGLPLALDYATFDGTPALVVVLPSSKADKVDVLVVPAGCAMADGRVLYFTRLPKP